MTGLRIVVPMLNTEGTIIDRIATRIMGMEDLAATAKFIWRSSLSSSEQKVATKTSTCRARAYMLASWMKPARQVTAPAKARRGVIAVTFCTDPFSTCIEAVARTVLIVTNNETIINRHLKERGSCGVPRW